MKPAGNRYCPRCGSQEVAEIVYGLVTPDIEAEYPGRRIILGGCVVEPTSPRWKCLRCGNTSGRASLDGGSDE
jgi:ribosomal protein S27AE